MASLKWDEKDKIPLSSSSLLRNSLLLSALIFLLLEIWRPCFFLTDDNLSGGLPVFSEIGRHLWQGRSPFVSDYLFGGNYNLLGDPTFFCWHPFYLVSSLLVVTPARFLIIEAPAFFFLLLATAGFVLLASFLRRQLSLQISDGWITFYALSYTYTFMALATGASWLSFLGNHCALPWLALGILQTDWRRGFALVTLFTVHQILGGHFAPLVSCSIFLSLFAAGVALHRRSFMPLATWFGGYALAVILIWPLLGPAVHGFMSSHRAEGVTFSDMEIFRIPLICLPVSYFLGTDFWLLIHPDDYRVYHPTLAACAAGWCLIPSLANRTRWRFLEILCCGLAVILLFLIVRPRWITEAMIHVPLLRSLRWPFRELLVFQFFLHLLLLLRAPAADPRTLRVAAVVGFALFVIPLWLCAPPSFNPMKQQRQLLFSGELDRYWDKVKSHLKPSDRIAVVIPGDYYQPFGEWAPFALLGTHDFCSLIQVCNASGYSPAAPATQLYLHTPNSGPFGYFAPSQIDDLWREQPALKLVVLESENPLRITLRSQDGEVVDLTPYLPKEAR